MNLDLDDIIKSLNRRFEELDDYTFVDFDLNELVRKLALQRKLVADLHEEILKLERIRLELNAAVVAVTPVSDEERIELEKALQNVHIAIQRDEVWHRVISIGTASLEAGAKLRSAATRPPEAAGASVSALADSVSGRRLQRLLNRFSDSQ